MLLLPVPVYCERSKPFFVNQYSCLVEIDVEEHGHQFLGQLILGDPPSQHYLWNLKNTYFVLMRQEPKTLLLTVVNLETSFHSTVV